MSAAANGARRVAVVLGASASGLMAAGVLARAFARVVVVERDALEDAAPDDVAVGSAPLEQPSTPRVRKGIAQARHNHNVTPRATQVLEGIFPGLLDDLQARGATVCDAGRDGHWVVSGQRMPQVEVGAAQILASRPLLDATLLARLRALGDVEVRDRRDVCGLLADERGTRVRGVRLLDRSSGAEELLEADLVVDATGRGSRTPRWLEELGFDPPSEEHLEVAVSYTTRVFRRQPGDLDGSRFVYASAVPPHAARGGVAFAVERDRWMMLLFAYGEKPPSDLEGFRRFAGQLPAPELRRLAEGCEPLGDAATYSFPRSTRRRYDLCPRLPADLVVIGDALQCTNPSWGLGITSAALQVEVLRSKLARGSRPSERFFGDAIRAGDTVWGPVSLRDLAFDRVPGVAPAPARAIEAFFASALRAARHDHELARVVLGIIGHVRSPAALLRPDRMARILGLVLRERVVGASRLAASSGA